MHIETSCKSYEILKKENFCNDVKNLVNICRELNLPQKTVSFSCHSFFAAKEECKIEPDDVVLVAASIGLACKICETQRNPEKILHIAAYVYNIELDSTIIKLYLDSISKTELEISIALDFNFKIAEIYTELQKICKNNGIDPVICKRCWVLLNDIMLTPLSIFFTSSEIISATIFLVVLASVDNIDQSMDNYKCFVIYFSKIYTFKNLFWPAISFISNELLDIYIGDIEN